jgi:hypothetical protein
MSAPTLPTVGGSAGTWGTTLNAALTDLGTRRMLGGLKLIASSTSPASVTAAADSVCDGAADDVEIQAAIWALRGATLPNSGLGGGIVLLDAGLYDITQTLYIPQRIHLIGVDPSDQGIGTTLRLANGANCDVIRTEGTVGSSYWWHYGSLENLFVDGNKANNTWGTAFNIGTMGEVSRILSCYASRAAVDGFHFAGGRPSRVEGCSSFFNGRHGFNIVADHNYLVCPSGDGNGSGGAGSFIRVTGASNGNLGSVAIYHPKIEAPSDDTAHKVAILLDNAKCAVTLTGGNANHSPGAAGDALVRRIGAGINQKYEVWLFGRPTGGTITVQGQSIPYNASAATFQTAMDAAYGAGVLTVTGAGGSSGSWVLEYTGGGKNNAQLTGADTPSLSYSLTGGTNARAYLRRLEYGGTAMSSSYPVPLVQQFVGFNYTLQYDDQLNSANTVNKGTGTNVLNISPPSDNG